VGDPPNIIIASRADLTFTDFLVHMLPVVLVVLAVFLILIRVMFRKALAKPVTGVDALMALDEREAIKDPRLLLRSGVVLGVILIGFLLQRQTGISPSVVALVGAGIMILISPARPGELVEDVEWETLLFFIGLFILVGALVEVGALEQLAQFMANATDSQVVPTLMVVLIGSAVVSAIVDNIPYVTAMTPVVESLIASNPALGQDGALWWALALGADFGGNATLVGASANVVVVGIAARNGLHISFWTWMKYGVPTAAMSIAIAIPYVLLRYA
jgi:Na+/H+ antiporter NhaD/arsenite permease-like protein